MNVAALTRFTTSPTVRGSVLSVVDQGVCSLSNFLTGVIVARALMPEAFGVYSLYFTGIMLLAGFQNALITGPARVLGVRPAGVDISGYFRAQVRLQLMLSAVLITSTGVGLYLLHPGDTSVTLAFLLCLLLVQLQELARVICLTRLSLDRLLRLDLVSHSLRVGLLLTAMVFGVLSPGSALLVIAAACGLGLIVTIQGLGSRGATAPLRKTAAANWRYGRWLLLETLAYSASTQTYIYLTALWVDTTAVGGLSALLVLMNAVNVILSGMMNYAIPVARQRLLEDGYGAWQRWLVRVGILLAAAVGTFALIVSLFAESLLALIYGPTYVEFAFLVPLLALRTFLSACNMGIAAAFATAEMPQIGFAAKAVSAVATLALAYPLLAVWGVTGAAVGLVVTQLLWTMIYAIYACRGSLGVARVKAATEIHHAG